MMTRWYAISLCRVENVKNDPVIDDDVDGASSSYNNSRDNNDDDHDHDHGDGNYWHSTSICTVIQTFVYIFM